MRPGSPPRSEHSHLRKMIAFFSQALCHLLRRQTDRMEGGELSCLLVPETRLWEELRGFRTSTDPQGGLLHRVLLGPSGGNSLSSYSCC